MLDIAQRLYDDGHRDRAYDHICKTIMHYMRPKGLDKILETADVEKYSIELLVAVLGFTSPYRHELPHRDHFYDRVEDTIIKLLKGLD